MAYFICEKQGRCCPHEFYNSIEQAITDSEDGIPCDHLIEVAPVRHGRWVHEHISEGYAWVMCSECEAVIHKILINKRLNYCPNCGAKMDGGDSKKSLDNNPSL